MISNITKLKDLSWARARPIRIWEVCLGSVIPNCLEPLRSGAFLLPYLIWFRKPLGPTFGGISLQYGPLLTPGRLKRGASRISVWSAIGFDFLSFASVHQSAFHNQKMGSTQRHFDGAMGSRARISGTQRRCLQQNIAASWLPAGAGALRFRFYLVDIGPQVYRLRIKKGGHLNLISTLSLIPGRPSSE